MKGGSETSTILANYTLSLTMIFHLLLISSLLLLYWKEFTNHIGKETSRNGTHEADNNWKKQLEEEESLYPKDFCQRKTAPRQKSPRQATSPPIQSVAPGGNDSVELLETEQQCINEAIAVVNANLELRVSIRWVVFVTLMSQSTERGRVRNRQFRNVTVRKC